jgi:Glycosyltransferases involved in cell wall biogenesis
MQTKPLVSLITPCYNGAKHLQPYINGILAQMYPHVQYIFVNDGSTDETEKIILSYQKQIEAKGWEFIYIRQENKGQAAAMNAALLRVKGKYFSQIDSDDTIHPEYLEKYASFLESHKDCKFCYAHVNFVEEDAPDTIVQTRYRKIKDDEPDYFFRDLVMEQNVPPLAFYMMETKAFFEVAKLPIFEGRGGQNWQILLPMAYRYKCGYMNDVLATCVMRKDSHSHHSILDKEKRRDDLKILLFSIIAKIDMSDGEKAFWYDKITIKYLPKRQPAKIKFRLFGLIPLLKIKRDTVYLFEFIPIGKIKRASENYKTVL